MSKIILVAFAVSSLLLQGCAVIRDPRDAPWDPPRGRALFEQLPNWDGAALRVCGGHLPPGEAERQGRSRRC